MKSHSALAATALAASTATLFFLAPPGHGQTHENRPEPLITDRPDFTESPETVSSIQLEGGATFTRTGADKETSLGELLLRVPAGRKAELRFGFNSLLRTRTPTGDTRGWEDAELGVKLRLRESSGLYRFKKPAVSLIGLTSVPTGGRAYREDKWQPGAKLIVAGDLCPSFGLALNLNYARASDGGQRFNQYGASASLSHDISDRLGSFFEVYGTFPETPGGPHTKYFDTGLTYGVTPDFQLDARVGLGINNHRGGPDYFVGVGAAQRW